MRAAIATFGFADDEAIVIPGWFRDTIPGLTEHFGKRRIAMLRFDCDWYEPVRYVLDTMMPFVVEGATVILDDYYAWDGCALATHDYLSMNRLSYRLKSLPSLNAAHMTKRRHRADYRDL